MKTSGGEEISVNVAGSSSFGRNPKISSEKTYNMLLTMDGETPWLINFPGYQRAFEPFSNSGQGRGIFRSIRGNFILGVFNTAVYTFSSDLTPNFVGTLSTGYGEVTIDENLNSQVCIADGVNAYIYNYSLDGGNFLTTQDMGNGLIPNYVTFHDTYFLFGNSPKSDSSSSWYAYSFDDATHIKRTAQMALQTKPDSAIAVLRLPAQGGNVIVFGRSVCEIHSAQVGTLPYRRNNTISVDYGCISVSTIDASDKFVAWVGVNEKDNPVLLVYTGQGAERISSDGIDKQLEEIKYPEQSTASFLRVCGHLVYQFTFYNPADNLTLFYDFTTQKFFHLSDQYLNFHPARAYSYFNRNTYFVSLKNSSLYVLGSNITAINENIPPNNDIAEIFEIPRLRICSNLKMISSGRYIANRFVFTMEQGNDARATISSLNDVNPLLTEDNFNPPASISSENLPLSTEAGVMIVNENSWGGEGVYRSPYRPRVDLTISIDGGVSWSSTVSQDLNPVGYRQNIIDWNGLGICNSMTLKLRFLGTDRVCATMGILEIRGID